MVVSLGQQYNVEEKPTVILLYTLLIAKAEAKDTVNLNTAQLCYIGSGIG